MAGSTAKASALTLMLLVCLATRADAADRQGGGPRPVTQGGNGGLGAALFRVGEPVFRFRHAPEATVPESQLIGAAQKLRKVATLLGRTGSTTPNLNLARLEAYLGRPQHDP